MAAIRLEELTSFAWDMRLTLSCLQGITNRAQPRLYLIHDHYDELWLDWLRERGDVDTVEWLEVGQVFERFLPSGAPLYVTDPDVPASVNVATMLASVYGGIVATPNTLGLFRLKA
ncbi:MAG TPA: GxGYxYP domain-containing protein, partial [Terriglobia bacterium]|nr:GxGYxYP domain-containing protein [Terriglobia bacterium]